MRRRMDRGVHGPTSFVGRGAAVARLAARMGRASAFHKARRIFASASRKDELDLAHQMRSAQQVAETLGNMKGALMKIGQLASFVDDSMPEPVRQALSQLQQSAPPMSGDLAASVIERELGAGPDKLFAEWDPVPIAAASIGQVHRAITNDGQAVAVKVQYPGVDDAVRSDLANLDLARLGITALFPAMDSKAFVAEIKARLNEELDYSHEAENQAMFASWFEGHPFIHVPKVIGPMSTRRVLTTELATGARFEEMETWSQRERDLAGEAIYRFVFRSLYRFFAFNGDPHPGNYLFNKGGQVTFLDFGLVKRLQSQEVLVLYRFVRACVVDQNVSTIRAAGEEAGFIARGAPVSDERLVEFMSIFWEFVRKDELTTVTTEWASSVARRVLNGRAEFGDITKYASLDPSYAILQRINVGLLALLGRVEATANWRRLAEELWPSDGPPSTELGELEAKWWAKTHPDVVPLAI